MGKVFLAIVAVVASLVVVESLTCNRCSFNVLGVCVGSGEVNCTSNTSVCYTAKFSFNLLSDKLAVNNLGCSETNLGCGNSISGNASILGYNSSLDCCTTAKCNTVTLNGAPSAKVTFTAAAAGAILATVLGSIL